MRDQRQAPLSTSLHKPMSGQLQKDNAIRIHVDCKAAALAQQLFGSCIREAETTAVLVVPGAAVCCPGHPKVCNGSSAVLRQQDVAARGNKTKVRFWTPCNGMVGLRRSVLGAAVPHLDFRSQCTMLCWLCRYCSAPAMSTATWRPLQTDAFESRSHEIMRRQIGQLLCPAA